MKAIIKRRETIALIVLIITLITIYSFVGSKKEYLHMDEAYSYGLSNYDRVEIGDNEDFYDEWHDGEYYNDYLIVNDDEKGDFSPVYENQRDDVHPPLYYLFLRIFMEFYAGKFSMRPGIILNLIIQIPTILLLYAIAKRLFESKRLAYAATFFSSVSLSALSSATYIRMYALAAFFTLLTAWLHLLMMEKKKIFPYVPAIGLSALCGSLTHYYYLFFLAVLFLSSVIVFVKLKDKKILAAYLSAVSAAAVLSLAVFPYSIVHLFFGYRGQGAVENLTAAPRFLFSIGAYLIKVETFVFNHIAITAALICVSALVILKKRKSSIVFYNGKYAKFLFIPTAFYFLISSIASPYIELRYLLPVCPIISILAIYLIYGLILSVSSKKTACAVLASLAVSYCLLPFVVKEEPETLYTDKKKIVEMLEGEYNLPTVYCYNTGCDRFLDDIYLFSLLDESYIAKDPVYTLRTFRGIFASKDTSSGVVVFVNNGQDEWMIADTVKNALGLKDVFYLERLNACSVFYVK